VYVDDIPQTLGVDFTVEPVDSTARQVIFATAPATGQHILIAVTTQAQAFVTSGQYLFIDTNQGVVLTAGDVITVATWNDTRQQNIITTVYVGPVETGATVTEGFDETDFDAANINFEPGSFDYTAGTIVTKNDLFLTRADTIPTRLAVTLNGFRLFYGEDFTVVNGEIILAESIGTLNSADIVMITEFTNSQVPDAMAFRIFQDMRGAQATYRITTNSTTTLAQNLSSSDDVIYVDNAANLPTPELANNIWGVITINGERIMYRNIDTGNNTVSSLLRGTAGTAIADHSVGEYVYSLSRDNIMPTEFQNYIDSNTFMADGSTQQFVATNITFDDADSTLEVAAVEVWVGGTKLTDGYTITGSNPVVVEFDSPPANGSEIVVLVRRGVTWYAPGNGTPSNGVALQDTNTDAARFLRGL
jgi:hypothetical protein